MQVRYTESQGTDDLTAYKNSLEFSLQKSFYKIRFGKDMTELLRLRFCFVVESSDSTNLFAKSNNGFHFRHTHCVFTKDFSTLTDELFVRIVYIDNDSIVRTIYRSS